MLLVLSYRGDALDRSHPLRIVLGDLPGSDRVTRIELAGLSPLAVAELVGRAGLDAGELHRRTVGNPFYVTEVLAAGTGLVPHSVRDAVLAHAARLGEAAREVLDAAAVVPGPTELWLLEALAPPAAAEALDECLGSGMVVLAGGRVEFRHEIARQVVEESLPPGRRAGLHRAALAALAGQAVQDLARLAHHAEAAGDADAMLRFAPAAAELAAAAGARREAVGLYARALLFAARLEPVERAGLLERFAGLTFYIGLGEEGAAALREAVEIHRTRGDLLRQGDTLRQLGIRLGATGALAEAVTALEQVPAGPELALAYNAMAAVLGVFDDAEAQRWGQRAIDLAERIDCPAAVGDALNILGTAQLRLGDLDGLAKLDRSRELAQQAGDELGVVRAYERSAAVLAARREWVLAERYIEPGLAFCRERGLESSLWWLTVLAAEAALARGRWDDAASNAATILASQATGASHARVSALVILARVRARRGEPGYRPVLDEAAAIAKAAQVVQAALLRPPRGPRPRGWRGQRRCGSARRPSPPGSLGCPTSAGSPVSLRSGVTGPGWTAVTPPSSPNRTGWRSPAMPRAPPAGGRSGTAPTTRRWRWPTQVTGPRCAARWTSCMSLAPTRPRWPWRGGCARWASRACLAARGRVPRRIRRA
jgi:hypothetical protein